MSKNTSKVLLINQVDLQNFGCPNCGSLKGDSFIIFETCSIWGCENCWKECAVVKESADEIKQIEIRNTNIQDLIGKHPYAIQKNG